MRVALNNEPLTSRACGSLDASGVNWHRTATNARTEKRPREQLYCTTHAGYLGVQAYNLAACFPHTHRNISGTRWEPEPWAPSCVANKQTFGAMHHFRNDAKQGSVCQQKRNVSR